MTKDVKRHADIRFGHGLEAARSSDLCFLLKPLVRGNSSTSKPKSYSKPIAERES